MKIKSLPRVDSVPAPRKSVFQHIPKTSSEPLSDYYLARNAGAQRSPESLRRPRATKSRSEKLQPAYSFLTYDLVRPAKTPLGKRSERRSVQIGGDR